MMTLTISAILLIYLNSLFLLAEKKREMQIALMNINNNTIVITKLLTNEISAAGYIGCARWVNEFPMINHTELKLLPQNKLVVDSKSLTLIHANQNHTELIRDMNNNSLFYVTNNVTIAKGDVLLISNCQFAEIVNVKDVQSYSHEMTKVITTKPLTHRFEKNAFVSQLEINSFYMEKTHRVDVKGSPIYALYQIDIHHNKLEIIEGIKFLKMQVDYDEGKNAMGVAIEFTLASLNYFSLEKNGFIYAGLRN
jgi:hypothetical protein